MVPEFVALLKTGSIKSVVLFGETTTPAPPYVVAKPEPFVFGGEAMRVTAHFKPGDMYRLRSYMLTELYDLTDGKALVKGSKTINKLKCMEFKPEIVTVNDDKTISMERLVRVPSIY
jgi:hypothetical protein